MARALIIVDFQNDFVRPDGALPVPEGEQIADRLNELAASGHFDVIVATRDWHPPDHGSFREQGGPWPPHCVQGSKGAELNALLDRLRVDFVVDAGREAAAEGYSGFEDTNLAELLHEHQVDEVTIVGLATDYCVRHTALDALRLGFAVTLDTSGVRGIEPEGSRRALEEVREAGGRVT